MAVAVDRIKNIRLLKSMSPQELSILATIVSEKTLPENATIFVENMPGEALYMIEEGIVRVSRMVEEGEEQILAVVNNGDFLGEMALLDGGPRLTTARAMKPTRLFIIKNSDFQALLEKEPRVCVKLLKAIIEVFSKRLRNSDFLIKELMLCSGGH